MKVKDIQLSYYKDKDKQTMSAYRQRITMSALFSAVGVATIGVGSLVAVKAAKKQNIGLAVYGGALAIGATAYTITTVSMMLTELRQMRSFKDSGKEINAACDELITLIDQEDYEKATGLLNDLEFFVLHCESERTAMCRALGIINDIREISKEKVKGKVNSTADHLKKVGIILDTEWVPSDPENAEDPAPHSSNEEKPTETEEEPHKVIEYPNISAIEKLNDRRKGPIVGNFDYSNED